jgi:hypothetical protein
MGKRTLAMPADHRWHLGNSVSLPDVPPGDAATRGLLALLADGVLADETARTWADRRPAEYDPAAV